MHQQHIGSSLSKQNSLKHVRFREVENERNICAILWLIHMVVVHACMRIKSGNLREKKMTYTKQQIRSTVVPLNENDFTIK